MAGGKHKGETAAIYVQEAAPYEFLAGLPRARRVILFEVATSSLSCARPSRGCARGVRDDGVAAARLRSARAREGGVGAMCRIESQSHMPQVYSYDQHHEYSAHQCD